MNSNIEIKYPKGVIEQYIIEILTLGFCEDFLPVCFVKNEKDLVANYKITGFRCISAITNIKAGDILNILVSLFYGIADGEKHLVFLNEYNINEKTIYVDDQLICIKIMYMPSLQPIKNHQKIIDFVDSISEKASIEGKKYLKKIKKIITEESSSYYSLIHQIEIMRQEVYLCGIE